MRRLKKAGLIMLISSVLASSTLLPVFADQTAETPIITEVIPVETTTSTNDSAPPGPAADSAETAPTETPAETAPAPTETPAETAPVEAAPVQESAQTYIDTAGPLSVPKRVPRLQTTVMLADTFQWSAPYVNDQPVNTDNRPFASVSTFLEDIHGDILYRTYTSAYGWTSWVMNGQQTKLNDGWPYVEAIQFRFSGPVADQYDIYYTASLNNQVNTTWAKNGQTCGSMNQGLYMTGFQLKFVEKGTDAQLDTSNPCISAQQDGIQYIDGVLRYVTGFGTNYTGWGNDGDDWYYFNDSYPVTGWHYLDGYKYYFGEDGKLWTDLEPLIGTSGPFMIRINKEMNCLTVYAQDGENGFIIPVKSFLTSCGDDTPLGTFVTPEKYRWRLMINDVWTQYATRLGKGMSILMHSIIYDEPNSYTVWASTYNNLGIARSAGCIRLTTADSKWIYDYCPVGTVVEIYESPTPGPYNRPTIAYEIPFEQRWDPTDDSVTPEGIAAAKQQIYAAFGYQPQ